ncbi:MAG TPA: S8 family peptidase, partial [Verrucomicrobiae bacterium]
MLFALQKNFGGIRYSVAWLMGLFLLFRPAVALAADPVPDYVEHEVLVQFQPGKSWSSAAAVASLHSCQIAQRFEWLSNRRGQLMCLLRSPNLTTAELVARLSHEPSVALVEPNHLRWVQAMRPPNDPKFSQLWGLQNTGQEVDGINGINGDDIGFLTAWGLARPSTNEVVVGVIDSGLDVTHPDLVSNLWTNPGEIAGNGVDDDGNGYVDDIHGYDFVLNTGTLTDSGIHGTHVSGTIAATGNNNLGVIGVDFQAHLMGLKVSSNGTNFTTAAIISAIQYATMMKTTYGVNIVALNASYGGGSSNSTERAAMLSAGAAGIIFSVAAGNNTNNNDSVPEYPASYRLTNEIVVAATDQNDALSDFSDYGAKTVDLAAPGVNILSTTPVNQPGYDTYVQQT